MLKVNFNFLPDLTTGWSQAMKDSVIHFGGNTFRWIQNTHGTPLINCGMFAAMTAASFVAVDKLATTLGFPVDQIPSKEGETITPAQNRKGFLIKGLVTGGLTYAGSLLYSSLSGHKLPQVIMLATAVAACTVRYFGRVHQGNNQPASDEVAPPLVHENKADEDTFARQTSNDAKEVTASGTTPLELPVVTHKYFETSDEEVSSSKIPYSNNPYSATSIVYAKNWETRGKENKPTMNEIGQTSDLQQNQKSAERKKGERKPLAVRIQPGNTISTAHKTKFWDFENSSIHQDSENIGRSGVYGTLMGFHRILNVR